MEHIYFEAQLCINISNFNDNSNIDILIILALGTSLHGVIGWLLVEARKEIAR